MPSEQAKDPGGLETRTVNLQAPGFFCALVLCFPFSAPSPPRVELVLLLSVVPAS